ncbi:MAG: zinc ABC transporter substrate-binding protein, partial [Dehalococcoidia bacterium]|nr:zinc ABC transporter substrate-binding protein [Dehalococcoidia bacterium]
WLGKLIEANREMLVVDCSRGIELIDQVDTGDEGHDEEEYSHPGADPHIWLSVRNAKVMVENICDGLVQIDPAGEDYYRENCAAYVEQLTMLDVELTELMRPLAGKEFIVFHPSFGYFARDYNLTQTAVEQGGSEPDAQYLVRLIEKAREAGIRFVFVSPQVSARSAEVIASEIGGEVVVIDPLAKDYIPNMRAIAEAVRQSG